jgi:biotin carboxyl carrier protein
MKMEMAVAAPAAGRITRIEATPGQALRSGDVIALMETRHAT